MIVNNRSEYIDESSAEKLPLFNEWKDLITRLTKGVYEYCTENKSNNA
jgi:hypothetical protein